VLDGDNPRINIQATLTYTPGNHFDAPEGVKLDEASGSDLYAAGS
jgi:hypothetical protein